MRDVVEMTAGKGKPQRSLRLIMALLIVILALITVIGGFAYQGLEKPNYRNTTPGFDFTFFDSTPDPADVTRLSPEAEQLYSRRIPVEYHNGTQISVVERADAGDVSYGTLTSLLRDDRTERGRYSEDCVCSNFAVQVHDNMERAGVDAHLVIIEFEDDGIPHMIVAFDTTDKGMVYVDDTGLTGEQLAAGLLARDRIVDLVPGQPYRTHFLSPYDETADRLDLGTVKSVEFIT